MARLISALVLGAVLALAAAADPFRFANSLGSHMVLQRGPEKATIWGFSDAGDSVTVALNTTSFSTTVTADANGRWEVSLPPMPSSFKPSTINATSDKHKTTIQIDDVLFGEVWHCGGQSNMGIPVDYIFDSDAVLNQSATMPFVRVFHVASTMTSDTPLADLDPTQIAMPWSIPDNASVPLESRNLRGFSAVCWLFGADVFQGLGANVPVGLIQDQWGGTPVQAWSTPESLAQCNRNVTIDDESVDQPSQGSPTVLYNSMIAPILPMRLAGFIWYQGEANVDGRDEWGPEFYRCAFPSMITAWRIAFKSLSAPFYFVQLAPYCNGDTHCNMTAPGSADVYLPALREAQEAALILPHVAMATAIDLGDQTAPAGSVHPRNKTLVGKRLSAKALALTYNMNNIPYHRPELYEAILTSPDQVTVAFQDATLYGGLVVLPAACPKNGMSNVFCNGAGFEVYANATVPEPRQADWIQVQATQVNNTIVLDVSTLIHVDSVRYAHADWPLATVYNMQLFPLAPFTTPVFKPSLAEL